MLKILYVDDESVNLDLFEIAFKRDFIVYKSLSPAEGLDIFKEEDIDVVVTDLKMPEMNGVELIREVKKIQPDVICILLTGYYEPELAADPEIKDLVYKYLLKPLRKQELKNYIIDACS